MVDGTPGGLTPVSAFKEGGVEIALTPAFTQPNTNYNVNIWDGLTINQVNTVGTYRLFITDPIEFNNAVRIRYQLGQYNGPGNGVEITAGTGRVWGIAWVYTA